MNEPIQEALVAKAKNYTDLDEIIAEAVGMNCKQLIHIAQHLVVESDYELEEATAFLVDIKKSYKMAEEYFDKRLAPVNEIRNLLLGDKKMWIDPLKQAEEAAKLRIQSYTAEQRRKAEEEAARQRLELQQKEQERIRQQAEALKAQGEEAAAANLELEAELLPPPVVTVPKTYVPAGQTERTTWQAELLDLGRLVAYIAQHPQFLNLVTFNATAGNALARSMKDSMNIPGLRAVPKTTLAQSIKR